MKNLSVILCLMSVLILASCGSSSDYQQNEETSEAVVAELPLQEEETLEEEVVEETLEEELPEEEVPTQEEEVVEESNVEEEIVVEAANTESEVLTPEQSEAYEEERAEAEELQEQLEAELAQADLVTMLSGTFSGIAPGHDARGGVTVKDNGESVIIELAGDFSSDQGPDLYLTLSQKQTLTGADPVQLDTSKILKVSALTSVNGSQSYEVSKADFDANNYAVVIWCNQFNVVFGSATLN